MKVLWIDPGKSTGWATINIDEDHNISAGLFGVTKDMTLVEIVDEIRTADVVGYETFLLRPDLAQRGRFNWNDFPPVKVIGSFETLCKLHGKTPVKQNAAQRIPGYAFVGMDYKAGAKGKHWQDALAHAVFYAVRHLGAIPVTAKKDESAVDPVT